MLKNYLNEEVQANLMSFYKDHPMSKEDFVEGMLASYNVPEAPRGCSTSANLLKQIETPDAAHKLTNGYHAMHFCLAEFAHADMLRYLEKAKTTYSQDDWKHLSAPVNHAFGLLHALALNSDEDAAIAACDSLKSIEGVTFFAEGGYIGFTPAHLAVLNGKKRLAHHLRLRSEVEPGKEVVTAFSLSSHTLEDHLADGADWRRDALHKVPEHRHLSHPIPEREKLQATQTLMENHELFTHDKFKELMGKNGIRKHSVFGEGTSDGTRNRKPASWLAGLCLPMDVNLFFWTPFHLEVVKPDCTEEQLETLKNAHPEYLLNKDAQGRSALFYACACGTEAVIKWCIRNFIERDAQRMKEYDVYHRSLLTALMHNPNDEVVTACLPELLSHAVPTEADLFGWNPVFYGMMMGHSQAACDIYKTMADALGEAWKPKMDFWENTMEQAKALNDATAKSYLRNNKPQDDSWSKGVFGGLY